MLHLTAERLAALADEEPTMLEAAHLAACPECCRERSAHQRLVALAAEERTRIAPPLTRWESLGPALARMRAEERGDTEVATVDDPQVVPIAAAAGRRSGGWSRARVWGLRAASALVLLGAGAVAGRMSAAPERRSAPEETVASGADLTPAPGRARDILITLPKSAPIEFASSEEALRAMELAEHLYQQSQSYLVEHDTSSAPVDAAELYRARLAALDRVMQATQEALQETPLTAVDPTLNRYYKMTADAREATLRELRAKLPPGYDMKRF